VAISKALILKTIAGEWWNANVVEVEQNATETQQPPIESDAYTINGLPSDLYNCSQDGKPIAQPSTLIYIK